MGTEIKEKTLKYWKDNAEENYTTTPVSVLKYITILEELKKSNNIKVLINKFTHDLEQHLSDTTKTERVAKDSMMITMETFSTWIENNCT